MAETFPLPAPSSKIIQILEQTIRDAEKSPDLGPNNPDVIELKALLSKLRERGPVDELSQ